MGTGPGRIGIACWWCALLAAAPAPRVAAAEPLVADPSASVLAIRVSKSGLLSGLAHNHLFVPSRWHAEARYDPGRLPDTSVLVVVDASSMHDQEPRLNAASRDEVSRTALGPEVLDAKRFPEIRFRADEFRDASEVGNREVEGVLRGSLTLHGTTRPIAVSLKVRTEGPWLRATGSATFAQSDFGIRPYNTALGTIGVDDEVNVEFDLLMRPSSASAAMGGSAPGSGR